MKHFFSIQGNRPLYDKWDGTLREPSLDAIALKIAQRDNARIIPTGAVLS